MSCGRNVDVAEPTTPVANMTLEYDFYLFDLDGTLVDVEPGYIIDVIDEVGDAIGYTFSDEQAISIWRALRGPPERQLRALGIDTETFWAAFHDIEEPSSRVDATFLYDDATYIADIDQPVGLVTHCQPYITEPVLEGLDIADWFDTVVCCHDDIGWKPDPAPIGKAIANLGVDDRIGEGVLAGDTAADVGAAWNAGIDGVHVERADPAERGLCIRADARIASLNDAFAGDSSSRLARQIGE